MRGLIIKRSLLIIENKEYGGLIAAEDRWKIDILTIFSHFPNGLKFWSKFFMAMMENTYSLFSIISRLRLIIKTFIFEIVGYV